MQEEEKKRKNKKKKERKKNLKIRKEINASATRINTNSVYKVHTNKSNQSSFCFHWNFHYTNAQFPFIISIENLSLSFTRYSKLTFRQFFCFFFVFLFLSYFWIFVYFIFGLILTNTNQIEQQSHKQTYRECFMVLKYYENIQKKRFKIQLKTVKFRYSFFCVLFLESKKIKSLLDFELQFHCY